MNGATTLPGSESALVQAITWINELMLGTLATGLCVLAISFVGLLMLMGQMPIRHGMRVIVGCFILQWAPVIATGISGVWQSAMPAMPEPNVIIPPEAGASLSPAGRDPYAGASLRRN